MYYFLRQCFVGCIVQNNIISELFRAANRRLLRIPGTEKEQTLFNMPVAEVRRPSGNVNRKCPDVPSAQFSSNFFLQCAS
jgi:hypothetical protein